MTTSLLKLSVAAVLAVSSMAMADEWRREPCDDHGGRREQGWQNANWQNQPPAGQPGGRYEQRATQRWVQGAWTQVWVEGQCYEQRGHHHKFKPQFCTAGHYDNRWTPAHYETVSEWVWVPFVSATPVAPVVYAPPPPAGTHFGLSASPAGVSFTIGARR